MNELRKLTGKERIIFAGSRSSQIIGSMEGRIAVSHGIIDHWETGDVLPLLSVLCPSDSEELVRLRSSLNTLVNAEESSLAMLMEDAESIDPVPGSMVFSSSEFSIGVLAHACNLMSIAISQPDSMNSMVWMRTGFLLPFFIHNMNNMLARIMGNIELADFHSGDPEKRKNKLDIAMESSEDFRYFLEALSDQVSMEIDNEIQWVRGDEENILKLGCLASGTSVEYSKKEEGSIPETLPVSGGALNIIIGILSSCATRSVAGCGSINLKTVGGDNSVSQNVEWKRPYGSSHHSRRDSRDISTLMASAAVISCRYGLSFHLSEWTASEGSVGVTVPLKRFQQ